MFIRKLCLWAYFSMLRGTQLGWHRGTEDHRPPVTPHQQHSEPMDCRETHLNAFALSFVCR